jgi:hypothetical protein
MDWIASLFSSSGVSFRSGAVATKTAKGSRFDGAPDFQLAAYVQISAQEFTTPARQNFSDYANTRYGHAALRLAFLVGASLMAHPMADKTVMMVPIRGFLPFERAL